MTTQESIPPDAKADTPDKPRTGTNWGRVIALFGKWSTWQQGPLRNTDVELGSTSNRCASEANGG